MPVHNYMIDDLAGTLKAIGLFPIFLGFPGYALAWLIDLFEFRRRTLAFRATLTLPVSVALCPILTFLLARFAGLIAVWAFYGLAALFFCVTLAIDLRRGYFRRRPFFPPGAGTVAVVLGLWLAICVFSLIDLQIGGRVYYPTSVFDYSVRTAFVHSISITGVPPQNPFFLPGHPVTLRYHYFWLLMCSLLQQTSGSGSSARHAVIAGTFWVGVGMIAILAIYLRLLCTGNRSLLYRRLRIGVVLLAITGLDILPSLFFWWLYARGVVTFVQPGVELWNEHVEWFLGTVVSTPHAIAALISCLLAFLLLWPEAAPRRYIIPAALAIASSAGCSIWVIFVFAIFLAVWTAVSLYQRSYRQTLTLCAAGFLSVLFALPYLQEINGGGSGGPFVQLTVRAFSFSALVPTPGLSGVWRLILVNGLLLPFNYLLEFGLFFVVAGLKWKQLRAAGRPLSRQDLALTIMAVISTLVCTFLTSSVIGNNDLGWRGFLIAQFVLVIWAVDIFGENLPFINPSKKQLMAIFLVLGLVGTVTDLAAIRFYPLLSDAGIVPPLAWMTPDRDFGHRTYDAREAYRYLRATTPSTATVQPNPGIAYTNTYEMLYGDRHTVAIDNTCDTVFGGDASECTPIVSSLQELFPPSGRDATAGVQDVCGKFGIDVVVAKDTDRIWSDRGSWVWQEHPIYANSHLRLFGCRAIRSGRK